MLDENQNKEQEFVDNTATSQTEAERYNRFMSSETFETKIVKTPEEIEEEKEKTRSLIKTKDSDLKYLNPDGTKEYSSYYQAATSIREFYDPMDTTKHKSNKIEIKSNYHSVNFEKMNDKEHLEYKIYKHLTKMIEDNLDGNLILRLANKFTKHKKLAKLIYGLFVTLGLILFFGGIGLSGYLYGNSVDWFKNYSFQLEKIKVPAIILGSMLIVAIIFFIVATVSRKKHIKFAAKYECCSYMYVGERLMSKKYTWNELKKYAFESTEHLRYVTNMSEQSWVSNLKYPDIPHGKQLKPFEYSQRYKYKTLDFIFQDVIMLDNNDEYIKMDKDKLREQNFRESIQPTILGKINSLTFFSISAESLLNNNIEIPNFSIYKRFHTWENVHDFRLSPVKTNDITFDNTYDLHSSGNRSQITSLVKALNIFKNNPDFKKTYSIDSSSIWAKNNSLNGMLAYEDVEKANWQTFNAVDYAEFDEYSLILIKKETNQFTEQNSKQIMNLYQIISVIHQLKSYFANIYENIKENLDPIIQIIYLVDKFTDEANRKIIE